MAPDASEKMGPEQWDTRYGGPGLVWDSAPNRFVAQECAGLPAGTALDLACGEGRNAVWLATAGWVVTAVDFSDVALNKGRGLARDAGARVDWQNQDLTSWSPPPAAFDLVLWCYLQLPDPDRSEVLERAWAAVAPGGTLLLVAHDLANLEQGWGGPRSPGVLTTVDGVLSVIGENAVTDRAEVAPRPVKTPEGERFALDTLVRVRRPSRPGTH